MKSKRKKFSGNVIMFWIHTTFKDYCTKRGIELLRDDLKFIEKKLYLIHSDLHKSIMGDFVEKWCEGMGYTEIDSQKQNLGRNKANLWLLFHINKIKK